jgi:hypothetical protein
MYQNTRHFIPEDITSYLLTALWTIAYTNQDDGNVRYHSENENQVPYKSMTREKFIFLHVL